MSRASAVERARLALCASALAIFLFSSFAPLIAQTVNPNLGVNQGISFASLTGPNGAPYTGSTEGNFTVTPTAGNWYQSLVYGNPVPSIYDGPTNSPGIGALVISDSVGSFTLASLGYSSNNGDSTYDIQGFLGASLQFEETGTLSASFPPNFSFQTLFILHSTMPINGLVIEVSPGTGATSINLDNISVATIIPEPGNLLLLGTGVAALLLGRRALRSE